MFSTENFFIVDSRWSNVCNYLIDFLVQILIGDYCVCLDLVFDCFIQLKIMSCTFPALRGCDSRSKFLSFRYWSAGDCY